MEIRKIKLSEIEPAYYNPRKDLKPGDAEYEQLRRSMEEFGCVEPLVWNKRNGRLVGGHQRLKILKEKGCEEIEVSVVDLDEQKEKLLNLALNKIQGEWDMLGLDALLSELREMDVDLSISGFGDYDFSNINEGLTDPDEVPEVPEKPVTKIGDIWIMENHRLLCGDSTKAIKAIDVERLMNGQKADMVFTDPPYGIEIVSTKKNQRFYRIRWQTWFCWC